MLCPCDALSIIFIRVRLFTIDFARGDTIEGLVIDDYYSCEKVPVFFFLFFFFFFSLVISKYMEPGSHKLNFWFKVITH
jgi:hypothetical protein